MNTLQLPRDIEKALQLSWQSGIDRHLIDIHLFGEYNFSIPRDGVGIMTKPLRGDAISNP